MFKLNVSVAVVQVVVVLLRVVEAAEIMRKRTVSQSHHLERFR